MAETKKEKTINEKKLYEELEIIFEKEKIIMQIIRDIKIIFVEQTK